MAVLLLWGIIYNPFNLTISPTFVHLQAKITSPPFDQPMGPDTSHIALLLFPPRQALLARPARSVAGHGEPAEPAEDGKARMARRRWARHGGQGQTCSVEAVLMVDLGGV